ncbi:MAG: TGS domain-containing protein, partial [Bdellovibrionales bacterium]|nr:TGS domain-containing protein [Bdellovibrionales bacterium]
MSVSIKLPDGSEKTFPAPPSGLELAKSLGSRLAKDAMGFLVEGKEDIQDIRSLLKNGDQVRIVACPSKEALEVIRHSAAHVLAQAVQNLWPEVKVTIGPVIENGFYYDFDTDKKFTPEDLSAIEEEMKKIIKAGYEVTREVWPSEKAMRYFEEKGEILKREIIQDLGEKEVSIYKQGNWLDLCKGPHVQNLSQIGTIKVLSHSGAYWRGGSKNKHPPRTYITALSY